MRRCWAARREERFEFNVRNCHDDKSVRYRVSRCPVSPYDHSYAVKALDRCALSFSSALSATKLFVATPRPLLSRGNTKRGITHFRVRGVSRVCDVLREFSTGYPLPFPLNGKQSRSRRVSFSIPREERVRIEIGNRRNSKILVRSIGVWRWTFCKKVQILAMRDGFFLSPWWNYYVYYAKKKSMFAHMDFIHGRCLQ